VGWWVVHNSSVFTVQNEFLFLLYSFLFSSYQLRCWYEKFLSTGRRNWLPLLLTPHTQRLRTPDLSEMCTALWRHDRAVPWALGRVRLAPEMFTIGLYCIRIAPRFFGHRTRLGKFDASLGDRHSFQFYSAPTRCGLGAFSGEGEVLSHVVIPTQAH
jgi:hypothetical protein